MISESCFSCENTHFLSIRKNDAFNQEFVLERKEKLLLAFSDIAILEEITKRNALSVPDIISFFDTKYGIKISPGTIYPIFYRLESRGCIRVLPNRKKKIYVLAGSDNQTLKNLQYHIEEIQSFIICLLDK